MQTSSSRTPAVVANTPRWVPQGRLARPYTASSAFLGQRNRLQVLLKARECRRPTVSVQAAVDVWQTLAQLKVIARVKYDRQVSASCTPSLILLVLLQGGAASLAVFLETAPPPLYLVYMLAAGFGLPVSTTEPTDSPTCFVCYAPILIIAVPCAQSVSDSQSVLSAVQRRCVGSLGRIEHL